MALNQLDFYMDASRAAKETGISYLSNMPIWGPVYFLRSMKYVDQVLGNADRFPHAQIEMSRSKRFLGEGILTSDGVAWKHARRQLSRPFSVTSISTMLGAIQHEVIECVKKWPIGIPFDLNQALSEMVLRIFARVILGAQTPEEMNAIGELSKTIKSFMHLLFLDFIAPRPMSPYLPAFKRNHQKIQQFLYGMIDQRSVKQEESGQNMRNNLLSILLSAGTDLTTPQIEMNLRQLFMAANDTSSAALGTGVAIPRQVGLDVGRASREDASMQNLVEYLASERAREDVRLLIHGSVGYLRVGHGTWNLGSDGVWNTAIYHANTTRQDHTVYYRLDGERYVVTDLGEGVWVLRLRTGKLDQPDVEVIQPGTRGVALYNNEIMYSDEATPTGGVRFSVILDLPDAICKVMLASLRVTAL
jgi:hypothetical protein